MCSTVLIAICHLSAHTVMYACCGVSGGSGCVRRCGEGGGAQGQLARHLPLQHSADPILVPACFPSLSTSFYLFLQRLAVFCVFLWFGFCVAKTVLMFVKPTSPVVRPLVYSELAYRLLVLQVNCRLVAMTFAIHMFLTQVLICQFIIAFIKYNLQQFHVLKNVADFCDIF